MSDSIKKFAELEDNGFSHTRNGEHLNSILTIVKRHRDEGTLDKLLNKIDDMETFDKGLLPHIVFQIASDSVWVDELCNK